MSAILSIGMGNEKQVKLLCFLHLAGKPCVHQRFVKLNVKGTYR